MIKTELLKVAKPIAFNTAMTKAILDGRKIQTRRIIANIKYLDEKSICFNGKNSIQGRFIEYKFIDTTIREFEKTFINLHSKYQIDDILWVREPVKIVAIDKRHMGMSINYLAGGYKDLTIPNRFIEDDCITLNRKWFGIGKGIPNGCIKEMARIFLKVTNVRVERLRNMCIKDMIKEGFNPKNSPVNSVQDAQDWWINLWNSTASKGYKWEDNPYVFVCEFKRV